MTTPTEVVPQWYYDNRSALIEDIGEQIISKELTHYASRLLEAGLHDRGELERSLQKAIRAVNTAHLQASNHFKTVFVCGMEITHDWLVSDLGIRLILLNADVSNPLVARLQVEILSDGI